MGQIEWLPPLTRLPGGIAICQVRGVQRHAKSRTAGVILVEPFALAHVGAQSGDLSLGAEAAAEYPIRVQLWQPTPQARARVNISA